LESDDGEVYGAVTTGPLNVDWQQFQGVIKVNQSDDRARLTVTTSGRGKLYVDMVSLFPQKTFKGRKNGLRPDLAQALADLNPKFLRFPGGCITHGCSLQNAYRWKDTVGDVAQRRPNWNRWGYHQTCGLGYYEYFLLCEDLAAAPLPVVPVGVSCGYNKPYQVAPLDELQEWIDDALDLVEFANGPVDSTWGKVRADMGHPEPFGLEYICLGNEEHDTPEVRERIPYFVKAIRQTYPEIKLIGTSGLGQNAPLYPLMKELDVHSSDEHYYNSPEWYIQNQDRFDGFERNGPKIFVGEYASRGNSLYNAVAEACYLTGIERNADIVHMTTYAPLFARYGFTQWNAANLIWFDHKTVVRTPNYYVQRLFALNKGDRYLKNESVFQPVPASERSPAFGQIGLGTWETSAVFDDIKVASGDRTLIAEDFAEGATGWEVVAGQYAVKDGAYAQTDPGATPAVSLCPTRIDAPRVTYSLRAKRIGGREGFLILFGSKASGYYWWNIGGWGNTNHAVQKGGKSYETGKSTVASRKGSIRDNLWYDVRIELAGERITCFLNDELIHDVATEQPEIGVAASTEEASGDILVKIANPLTRPQRTRINLRGVDAVKPTATLSLLKGEKDDVNDLANPDRVKPVVSRIPVATSFDYTIPPMSVQVIRIEKRKN
jgi:alpha-L-arabinofuranosidase